MERRRIQILVEVDLDPVPGSFHTGENTQEHIQHMLDGAIPHYNPVATYTPV